MLNENIKRLRKAKGISQEELALKLNVVRQTVSKWENGLSVPDSELLIALSEELDAPVSVLLGETVPEAAPDDLGTISEKLELINLQLARKKERKIKTVRWLLFAVCVLILAVFTALLFFQSAYLNWNYDEAEWAVAGTLLHGFEFVFVRLAPFVFLLSAAGIILTYRKH